MHQFQCWNFFENTSQWMLFEFCSKQLPVLLKGWNYVNIENIWEESFIEWNNIEHWTSIHLQIISNDPWLNLCVVVVKISSDFRNMNNPFTSFLGHLCSCLSVSVIHLKSWNKEWYWQRDGDDSLNGNYLRDFLGKIFAKPTCDGAENTHYHSQHRLGYHITIS